MASWNYSTGEGGPHTWANNFPAAAGINQSPIDIDADVAEFDPGLQSKSLQINWEPNCVKCISNTGHGWMVSVDGKKSTLTGGPLSDTYQLEQFHVHWGSDDLCGSEHTVNGKSYPAELHLVHFNRDKFPSISEAVKRKNGLAVLGVFLEVDNEHDDLKKLTNCMCNIKYNKQSVDLTQGFNLSSLLPGDIKQFWTYPGSLTTPPCYESVTWIVFKDPIKVSKDQMLDMRKLFCYCEGEKAPDNGFSGKLVNNYRPTLPLGNRKLRKSFQ